MKYPVGLITADEVAMAGGVHGILNSDYYLCVSEWYWTMTPYGFKTTGSGASVFGVAPTGEFSVPDVSGSNGVRPVINIASDVEITGSGTSSDPYVVVGAE